jgi:hypothetical protein
MCCLQNNLCHKGKVVSVFNKVPYIEVYRREDEYLHLLLLTLG